MASDQSVSPLAPSSFVHLPLLDGVRFATIEAGIKYRGRDDVLLLVFDQPAEVAGVFTRSKCASAPVDWCRSGLDAGGTARALLVNSGNANAFTGVKGRESTQASAGFVADAIGCDASEVYLASTGVIGEPLDASAFERVLSELATNLSGNDWLKAAGAIMTTDTYPKVATRTALIDGVEVILNGMAKGAGMIAPDMATMLSFVFTDANVSADVLQNILRGAVEPSFNSITVDSDTSTSDTLLAFATSGCAHERIETADDPRLADFRAAFEALCLDLAHQVVRDGEGARKFVEIKVSGAENAVAAKRVAMSVANSPLVKTAIAGEDANWGRVVMAVGKAGERANRDLLAIWFGDVRVAVHGERDPDYSEEAASAVMREEHIALSIDLGIAKGEATVWTCDLTKDYVAINGDYRS